ncbi:selenocysteine-specific translation elongation factor [Gephyromycinifex aptenodytis]|uniref:selenocysteine-specific translation elongation factor n=1 Tax=Gephyromycinifex aptenodytis TaxID=2716227 RepID=UPI00144797D5|nr:selenocysteine-specific translation elongation factor [Gephyromycinifex aptenodytis]
MYVIATAGHVDHGKSTLVRALTGMEPDRWEEERRRAVTIDLGYAWTTLDTGEQIAFVDVPGHRRFIGNMLAGLGPAPAVLFVVAADEGWMPQSSEHLAAIRALGLSHVALAVTRADLADPAPALEQARAELTAAGCPPVDSVAVCARTGQGLPELRAALATLVRALPPPDPDARVRLWIDRAFTITGAGTVVTGTLASGTIGVGDELELAGNRVSVRGLQSLEQDQQEVRAYARVALNLRGVSAAAVHRGQALCSPGRWHESDVIDARLTFPRDARVSVATHPGRSGQHSEGPRLPEHLMLHIGTAATQVRVRPLSATSARLHLDRPLPVQAGDRAILRDPGTGMVLGAHVLDVDPPPLRRRGEGARRGEQLAEHRGHADLGTEVVRRGYLSLEHAARLGLAVPETVPPEVIRTQDWLVASQTWSGWVKTLCEVVQARERSHPLDPLMPAPAAAQALGLPDARLLASLAAAADMVHEHGRVHRPGVSASLGAAEAGLAAIEARLASSPFAAPEQPELDSAGLGPREVAAAVKAGRLLALRDGVLVQPIAPAKAMRILVALPQPFTTSQARQALGTTRRVAIPLLEYLDERGWTRRLDAGHREVAR